MYHQQTLCGSQFVTLHFAVVEPSETASSSTVYEKKSFLRKESDTKILQSIFRLRECRHHQI